MRQAEETELPLRERDWMVNQKEPLAVGVPPRTPLVLFKVKPVGRAPSARRKDPPEPVAREMVVE